MLRSLVGSEMCIRDRADTATPSDNFAALAFLSKSVCLWRVFDVGFGRGCGGIDFRRTLRVRPCKRDFDIPVERRRLQPIPPHPLTISRLMRFCPKAFVCCRRLLCGLLEGVGVSTFGGCCEYVLVSSTFCSYPHPCRIAPPAADSVIPSDNFSAETFFKSAFTSPKYDVLAYLNIIRQPTCSCKFCFGPT